MEGNNQEATRTKLLTRLQGYIGDANVTTNIEVSEVESIISNLPRGKAAGLDNLTAEHLQYAHPLATCAIVKLFNICVELEYVPDSFGKGIIIPIRKCDSKRNYD